MVTDQLREKSFTLTLLVDSYYEFIEKLSRAHFECFRVEDSIIRYFCGDDITYRNERDFHILDNKCSVSLGKYGEIDCNEAYEKANQLAYTTGKNWLSSPSYFWRKYNKSEELDANHHKEIMLSFENDYQRAWENEIEYFSGEWHKQYASDNPHRWIDMVKDISSSNANNLGFTKSSKLSQSNKLTFLKKIDKEWSIYIGFDLHHLTLRIKDNHTVNHHIEFYFGLICNITGEKYSLTNNAQVKSILCFNYFFPIGLVFNQHMKNFRNLKELEAIINMNFKLYAILVHVGFENLLIEGVRL